MVWTLDSLRTAYCIEFLMDSSAAEKEIPKGAVPVRADQVDDLHPVLRQTVADSAPFAAWTPSRVCLFYFDRVQVGSRVYDGGRNREPVMIGVWSVPFRTPAGTESMAAELFSNSWRVSKAAETATIRFRTVDAEVTDTARDGTVEYWTKVDKTELDWSGRQIGDPKEVTEPLVQRWRARGTRGNEWSIALEVQPGSSRPVVGALSVSGKQDLAKALKASPIRFVGPVYLAGNGRLEFTRIARD